jgi:hypothetical protein
MGSWFACTECIFGSNSRKQAAAHEAKTGHTIDEEED